MLDSSHIQILADNDVIEAPGFYEMSLDRHHNQPCDGPSVTSGILRKMDPLIGTPADVWEHHLLNPNRRERAETDALRLGRVMAAYIECGPEGVEEHVQIIRGRAPTLTVTEMLQKVMQGHEFPENPPSRPAAKQVMAYAAGTATPAAARAVKYWLEIEADPRMKVTESEWALICDMGKVLAADPAATVVMEGVPEISMAWKDEATGLWCLARPDTVSFSGLSTDYKKMATMGTAFNERIVDSRITQHGYDMQGAFACEGFEILGGQWPDFGIIAQCGQAPYHVILREIPQDDLRIGQFRNHRSLGLFRECLDSGHWPGPGEDTGAYRRPEWQREKLLKQMQEAGYGS